LPGFLDFAVFRFLLLEDFSSVGFDSKRETLEYKALANIL